MRHSRRTTVAAAAAVVFATVLACFRAGFARTPPDPQRSWADSVLATLSLREKAAQMVWPTVLGDYTPEDSEQWEKVRGWIVEDGVGGFTVSVGSPLEIAAKTNAMQRISRLPLLFGADLEAGAGFRARGGYFIPNAIDLGGAVYFPPQMALGAAADTVLAYQQGRVTAREGRALGLHIAYAPVLDVNNNPANPVINTRSFGEDPRLDGQLGSAFIRGVQEHGMIATAKHFPGHGDTEINSHLALSVIEASRARLDTVELVPFRAAVASDVGAVMSFHGAMPALDSSLAPGTLSPLVLTGLLREELGFGGVVISDAMDMRGILARYGVAEATKLAVAAGVDILIQPLPLDVRETVDAVVAGVAEGRYPESRIDASAHRVLAMKERMGLARTRTVPLDSVRAIVGTADHLTIARTIAERSITLLKDSLEQVPLRAPAGTRVLSVTVARRTDLAAGVAFDAVLRSRFRGLRSLLVPADDATAGLERAARLADSAEVVIIGSYIGQRWDAVTADAPEAFARTVAGLAAAGRRPIVIAFGNPYLYRQTPSAPAYLVAWGGVPASQEAAARALLGQAAITGRMPVSVPPHYPLGAGIVRR